MVSITTASSAPGWVALTVAGVSVAVCLLLLFLLVFPLLNKYCGANFPCRNFRSVTRRKSKKTTSDASWVPTVPLPEMTGERADIRPERIRLAKRTVDRK